MEVTNNVQKSGNVQALLPTPIGSPHATAQADSEALKSVSPEQKRAPDQAREKASLKDFTEQVHETVQEMNAQLNLTNRSIRFSIDEQSHELVVKVVDTETDKVIKQIPADEILRLREHLKDLSGLIVEELA